MEIIKIANSKIRSIYFGIFIIIFIIIFRLFYLQICISDKLFIQSQKNFIRTQKIISPRGNIVDTNNHLLVTNRPVISLYWQGTGNKNLSKEQISALNEISLITEEKNIICEDEIKKIKIAEKFSKNNLIIQDLSLEKLGKILEKFPNSKNIAISTDFQRFYPYETLASHLIGYLNQIDTETIGKMGLEKLFEEELKGESGTVVTTINSLGQKLNIEQIKPPIPGKTIRTTIDIHMQKIAEKIFPKDFKGAFIIMDPENGAIRVSLSRPTFDPSIFLKQISIKEWKELQEKQPFLNRAFNSCYPPASIFKLITLSAALELGIINEDSKWFCTGHINFVNRKYHCAKAKVYGHGLITPRDAIIKSCNTFFYNIAKYIHIDDLAEYAHRFGLGSKTGILFAEKEGLIPTNAWKKKVYGQRWWPGETLSAVIGQSYLLVTPIQIAKMISAIFQKYLVNPRILEEEKIEKFPLNIKEEILEILKESMKTVVTTGTGKKIGKIKDITIYAKTGTVQPCILEKQESDNKQEYLDHAWFVSNFSFKENKPLTMVIFIENAGSTSIAIKTAREFLIEYKQFINDISS